MEGFNWSRWIRIGPAAITIGESRNYETQVALSINDYWTSGAAVSAGSIVFDELDQNDYVALTDITSGNNTTRPSNAVGSSNETIAGYWRLFGAGNSWAAHDYELTTKTTFVNGSGNVLTSSNWLGYWVMNSSTNLIDYPDDFTSSYWTASLCSITANTTNAPITSEPPQTADTLTINATGGHIWRTFTTATITGRRVILAVWAKYLSTSGTGTPEIRLIFWEGSTIKESHTFTLSNSWSYFQLHHTVTSSDDVFVGIQAKGVTASMALWGAHMGYAGAAFNRAIFAGIEGARAVKMGYFPYADLTNYKFSLSLTVESTCANRLRHDLTQNKSLFLDVFADNPLQIQTNTGLIYATNTALVYFYVTNADRSIPARIGSFALGEATTLGTTEWGVESSILSFSKKERDETFGTVSFVKRGNAKQLRATAFIDTDEISGDEVMAVLSAFEGQPVFYDFNNAGSDYDRLRVFGFQTNLRTVISAPTWESLSLDIEGLVE
jgi:hypothetical protein